MPQLVLPLSPLCFPLCSRFNSSSPGVLTTANVCVCVHVPITECVCVKRVSLTLSRTVCLTLSASSLLCLFFPSSPYQHSQVQPFSLPNPLLKTPQRLPKSAKPGSSCTIITSKQNMLCSERTIYTSTLRASFLSFCFQGTSFCDYCVCVWVLGGVNGWWLAGEVWFSRWHTGAPVAAAHYQLPQDSYTCETHYILTKTLKVGGSLFVWQWRTAKAIWRQCYNQLLVQKGSFRESHNYYGPTIHIFARGHHNFHASSVCNMIALWFKQQNGLCWTDLIIVQCSRLWWAITL